MCGIIAYAGRSDDALDVLMDGLSALEYRGYDSAGVALAGADLDVVKRAGELGALRSALDGERDPTGTVGIGHTRWSTHGPPTDVNAHPHTDCAGEVAVVHNGIIENYGDLREALSGLGHEFESGTDTEVVPHLIEHYRGQGMDREAAFRTAVDRLEGSYAIAAVFRDADAVLAARRDSPLVVGLGDVRESDALASQPEARGDSGVDEFYLASDVPAFRDRTDRVIYLEDGDHVRLDPDGVVVTDADGERRDPEVSRVMWSPEEAGKSGYDHYMLKEIHEQPRALRRTLRERVDELSGSVHIDELDDVDAPAEVLFVACGTSYHASLYGAMAFRERGVPASAVLASEYASRPVPTGEDTLVVGVTQSGETADTLAALRQAARRGARTLAVTNVVGSTAARECDDALFIRAGPEIGVAATKTFAGQLVALLLLVLMFETRDTRGHGVDVLEAISALRDLPDHVQEILDTSVAGGVAASIVDADAHFFVGRGYHYPVALEGALKMKEITYKHAEGFAAGELKHGPLALVTERTPVFAVVTGDGEAARKTMGNVKEVEARGAPVVAVTDGESEIGKYADHVMEIPETVPAVAPMLANVQLQLAAYRVANRLGRSIDKPRNLAKSVTVE